MEKKRWIEISFALIIVVAKRHANNKTLNQAKNTSFYRTREIEHKEVLGILRLIYVKQDISKQLAMKLL